MFAVFSMLTTVKTSLLLCAIILAGVNRSVSEQWHNMRCSSDPEQRLEDGTMADIGRFPWLGVVQHSFYIAGDTRFAVTPGVLIHRAYAIAPAYDMASVQHERVLNNTRFIVWYNREVKYSIMVSDFVLHPEFFSRPTYATIALLALILEGQTMAGINPKAVLPVCLPISGGGTLTAMYAVRMTDQNKQLHKEVYKMKYVKDKECQEFYDINKLSYKKMSPRLSLCAVTEQPMAPCVWDGGVALITRQNWGFWKIIGFSVRGPGCGVPARFLVVHDYMAWIDEVVTEPEPGTEEITKIGMRRLSPIAITLFKASKIVPKEQGYCTRGGRGQILYKDALEVTATKDFGQGFFYVIVTNLALFNCAVVTMEGITLRSNTAMWVEHYCHRESTGLAIGEHRPRNPLKRECFLYFKTSAFITFRFVFSFKVAIEVTLYGTMQIPKIVPNPFKVIQTTDRWVPTSELIRWQDFFPYYPMYWYL